jgi:phosphate starvation-inducible protein PhoH and related proteins
MAKAKTRSTKPKFVAINEEQAEAYDLCKETTVTFLVGPAGCTKSYTAMALAIDELLDDRVDNIVLTRPAIEACGEDLGFLPGSAKEKLHPYVHPMLMHVKDYAFDQRDIIMPKIELLPLAHMRGRTLSRCVAIMDEAQNANEEQMEMFLTRIGKGSRLIICGDPHQSDIRQNCLMSVAMHMSELEGIGVYQFTAKASTARHPLIPGIIGKFAERKHDRSSGLHGRH